MIKMKKIIASLLCFMMIFMSMSTLCLATEGAEENKSQIEPKLNTRIVFEGDTYWDMACKRMRKDFEGEISAVVWAVHKNKEVVLTTYGYVKYENIKKMDGEVISYDKETKTYRHNGDLLKLTSVNNGVVDFKDGVLTAGLDGTTNMELFNIKGEKIADINAEVKGTEVILNFPEGKFDAKVENSSVVILDKEGEEVAKLTSAGKVGLDVDMKDGALTVTATADGTSDLTVKGKEIIHVEAAAEGSVNASFTEGINAEGNANAKLDIAEKEIINAEVSGTVDAKLNFTEGLTVNGTANGAISLFEKLKAKLSGGAGAKIDAEGVEVSGNGELTVGENTQVAAGEATAGVKYNGESNLDASGSVLGMEIPPLNLKGNLFEMIKNLFSKIK